MFRIQITDYRINIIVIIFLFCYITTHSAAEDNNGTAAPNTEAEQTERTVKKKELDERRNFAFSLPGDNKTQSIDLFFEMPLKANGLKAKSVEITLRHSRK